MCTTCGKEKEQQYFPEIGKVCKSCYNKKQRIYRNENGNKATKKYEKTKRGFMMRLYRNMESRINGIQKLKFHLYANKHLLSREEFYGWAFSNNNFNVLFEKWELSNYNRKLTPSVDRIDSSKGYYLTNMEWVTHSENSRRGSISRHNKNFNKQI